MFLGVVPTVANWSAKGDEFSLILDQNPLVDFVELPESHQGLFYSNIICGVIRGALEMVYPHFVNHKNVWLCAYGLTGKLCFFLKFHKLTMFRCVHMD